MSPRPKKAAAIAGPGLEHLYRRPLGLGDVRQSAAREHEQERRRDPLLGELSRHAPEVLVRERLDVGVGDGRRRALELADLGRHFVRGGDEDFRLTLGDELDGLGLVTWVRIGVQEDHGDRGHAGGGEPLDRRQELLAVERLPDAAVGFHPLGHLAAQIPRHQRLRLGDVEVVQLELPLAPDLERVAEPRGRDEPGDGALALDERIGEERRGVHDAREVPRLEMPVCEDRRHPRGHRAHGIVVGRQHLAAPLPSGVVVVHHDVREGASDVDPERVAGRDRVDELVHGLGLGVDAENTRVGRAQPDNLRIPRPRALTSLTLGPRVWCGAPARGGRGVIAGLGR